MKRVEATSQTRKGLGFVRAIRGPRILGLGTLSIGIFGALYQGQVAFWLYPVLLAFGLVWPHVAYALASRSQTPIKTEYVNLRLDAAFCGFWAVAMGFNLAPTVLMLTVLLMDNAMVGGLALLVTSVVALLAGGGIAVLLVGVKFCLVSSLVVRATCLPFLVIYPVTIGVWSFRNSQKVNKERARLHQLNQRDSLSGIYSRDYWEHRLDEEFQRFKRYGRRAALVLLDIDHFKSINDNFGHANGDEAIRNVGLILNEQVRAGDIPARLGGDEFGILLPEANGMEAAAVVRRIQAAVAAARFGGPEQSFTLTMSFGIAELTEAATCPGDWTKCADEVLYAAKRRGRNTLEIFNNGGREPPCGQALGLT
ncbi:MAG: diguanylate cyclase [Acidocella sp.]|nr:diguanylate cyclase [Acidocella sp.]